MALEMPLHADSYCAYLGVEGRHKVQYKFREGYIVRAPRYKILLVSAKQAWDERGFSAGLAWVLREA